MPFSSADPNAFLAIGMQSAKGTPQVTATKIRYAKYLSGNDFRPELEVVDLREGGDGLDYGYSYKKSHKVTGQLVANARPELIGQILAVVLGGASWDGGSAPALHNFMTSHASYPWSTILAQHPGSDIAHLISDVRFAGFTLEMSSGEPWKITAPFTAITHGASFAALTPTYYVEEPFVYHYSPTYVIDGAADTTITSIRIDEGLSLEELQAQQVTLDEIIVQNRTFDIEITRRHEDPTLWKKVNTGAGISPTTSVATGSLRAGVAYGAAANLRQLDFFGPLISYRGLTFSELDPDGKTVYETIAARALKGATHTVFAQLKNAHASVYGP